MHFAQTTESKVESNDGLFAFCLNPAKRESEDEMILPLRALRPGGSVVLSDRIFN
jgi:hypothetical protein